MDPPVTTESEINELSFANSKLVEAIYYLNDTLGDNSTVLPKHGNSIKIHFVTTLPVYVIIFLTAILGNSLVIWTLVQNKRMRTVTNVFLLNLSISDLLLAVFCMPFSLISMMLHNFIFGPVMCVLIRYLQGVSVGVSCFTLVAISLERFFAICWPLHARKWQTLSHAYKVIVVCWLMAAIVTSPIAMVTKHQQFPDFAMCREHWYDRRLEKAFTVALAVLLLFLPLVVMSTAYGCIIYTLWTSIQNGHRETVNVNGRCTGSQQSLDNCRQGHYGSFPPQESHSSSGEGTPQRRIEHRRIIRQTNPERSRAAKLKVIRMLTMVVIEFFVCWTPLYVVQTWITFDQESAKRHISNVTWTFILVISYVSASCNPITYCFMNNKFRQSFFIILKCCHNKPKRQFSSRSDLMSSTRYNGTRLSTFKVSQVGYKNSIRDLLPVEKSHIISNVGARYSGDPV